MPFHLAFACPLEHVEQQVPATIWAIVYISDKNADERNDKMIAEIKKGQVYNKSNDFLTIEEKARLYDEKYGKGK